jgi:hypothetical protein
MVIDLNNLDRIGYMNIISQVSKQTNTSWKGHTYAMSKNASNFVNRMYRDLDDNNDKNLWNRSFGQADPQHLKYNQWQDYSAANKGFNEKRDGYIAKESKQYVGGQASAVIPGPNNDEAQKNTKIVNSALNNRVLPDHFQIYYDNKKQEGTGTIESFKEQYGIISDLTVQDIKFVTTPFMGEAVLQLQVKGKNKVGGSTSANQTRTVFLPLNQIKNSGLQEYINSPAFKVEMDVNAARLSPVENTTIVFKKGSDDIGTTLTWDFNKDKSKNSETVLIQTADGGVQEFAVGDDAISFMINEAVTNGYSYWVVKD